ncbi:hypothetical protein [Gracilibacillus alcaliphilus]|uniref:hypothetical protein n=1 Tax=Gracilibacillus alcaliphilus TaxID=1401441 RepID=UPI00195C4C9F|nr:hypothetical protein [Gracilibacillus alcaliphilus]MBM7679027.1 L-ascorbate metabolism protein UlaG (beta-lactamase superfamily) [Gracilibacillus alcaliphilus]
MRKSHVDLSEEALLAQMNGTLIADAAVAVWHLGQSSLVLKSRGIVCYFDPYLSNYIEEMQFLERNFPPLISSNPVENNDIIFISFLHQMNPAIHDHIPQTTFVCPTRCTHELIEPG